MNTHQDFTLAGDRLFNLPDFQDVGETVSVAYQRFHPLATVNGYDDRARQFRRQ